MDQQDLLIIVLVPTFIFGLQKYIEARASYRPPTKTDVRNVRKRYGARASTIVKMVPVLKSSILVLWIMSALGLAFGHDFGVKWVLVSIIIVGICAMSVIVNWRMITRRSEPT